MKRILAISLSVLALVSCATGAKTSTDVLPGFPTPDLGGKTAIVAHRGFWKCEAAGFSENSIASLKAAQDNGLWGSECDIHLTKDGVVIVNHNNDIDGLKIAENEWSVLKTHLLPNGERRPLLEEYLAQTRKCRTTRLIIEFKKQPTPEAEDELVEKTFKAMRKAGLYDPSRIIFISFSEHICRKVAAEHPQFVNQFLTSSKSKDMSPAQWGAAGINGIDYETTLFQRHPEWVKDAQSLGMSVNVWTVDKPEYIREMIGLGVNQITSNEPLLVRELLGDKEFVTRK